MALVLLTALVAACGRTASVTQFSIVPEPLFMLTKDGSYTIGRGVKVSAVSLGQNSPTAKYIMKSLRSIHLRPSLVASSEDSDISLVVNDTVNPELGTEGYLLEVRSSGVRISANTEIGLLYGYQTLLQMLPADATQTTYSGITLPECTILDYPRFAWRGLHINVSGQPLSYKSLRKVVDLMALYKLNRLCLDGGTWSADSLTWHLDTVRAYNRSEMGDLSQYATDLGIDVLWDSFPMLVDGLDAAFDSVRQGHEVVVSPADHWWFEHYQADPRYQPSAVEGVITLGAAYDYDLVPVGTASSMADGIVGGQCRLLTDCTATQQQIEYMLLPRLLAVAENLWSDREKRDWNHFRRKVEMQKDYLSSKGYSYCEGSFTPKFSARKVDDHVMNISISTEVPNTYIFYTTDMSTPTRESLIYIGPINLERGTHIKILPVYNGIERDSVYEFVIK